MGPVVRQHPPVAANDTTLPFPTSLSMTKSLSHLCSLNSELSSWTNRRILPSWQTLGDLAVAFYLTWSEVLPIAQLDFYTLYLSLFHLDHRCY